MELRKRHLAHSMKYGHKQQIIEHVVTGQVSFEFFSPEAFTWAADNSLLPTLPLHLNHCTIQIDLFYHSLWRVCKDNRCQSPHSRLSRSWYPQRCSETSKKLQGFLPECRGYSKEGKQENCKVLCDGWTTSAAVRLHGWYYENSLVLSILRWPWVIIYTVHIIYSLQYIFINESTAQLYFGSNTQPLPFGVAHGLASNAVDFILPCSAALHFWNAQKSTKSMQKWNSQIMSNSRTTLKSFSFSKKTQTQGPSGEWKIKVARCLPALLCGRERLLFWPRLRQVSQTNLKNLFPMPSQWNRLDKRWNQPQSRFSNQWQLRLQCLLLGHGPVQ